MFNMFSAWQQEAEKLKNGEITLVEYFEWKINWPNTCNGNKVIKQWRKTYSCSL